jgi:hypothetical protein
MLILGAQNFSTWPALSMVLPIKPEKLLPNIFFTDPNGIRANTVCKGGLAQPSAEFWSMQSESANFLGAATIRIFYTMGL